MKATRRALVWILTVLLLLAFPMSISAQQEGQESRFLRLERSMTNPLDDLVQFTNATVPSAASKAKTKTQWEVGEEEEFAVEGGTVESLYSDREDIIEVKGKRLLAKEAGSAEITVTFSDDSVQFFSLQVTGVAVSSVTLSKDFRLEAGESKSVKAEVLPKDATNPALTWTSSKPEVATVKNGKITAVSPGVAVITARNSGGNADTVKVTVFEIEPEAIEVDQERLLVEIIGEGRLKAEVLPPNTTDPTLEWKVEDETIAKVRSNGRIVPKAIGKTKLILTASNGLTKEVPLEVFEVKAQEIRLKVPPEDIQQTAKGYRAKLETTLTVGAKVLPENTTYPELTWESSDPSVAQVKDGTIQFLATGTVTIRCFVAGGVEQTLYFEVYDSTPILILIAGLSALLLGVFYWWYRRLKRRRKQRRQEVLERQNQEEQEETHDAN